MNDVEIIGRDVQELTERPQNNGILAADTDNILYLAEKADKYIAAMNRIMQAALKITNELDWVLIGGTPYLSESGATKIARLFGVSIELIGQPMVETDAEGYRTYTYRARFSLQNQSIECEGSRSMREDFFAGKERKKKPDEIDWRDVKMAAYTNCIGNGIKRLIPGLRGIDVATLEAAGLDCSKMKGYTFKSGSRGGNSGKAEESGLACSKCGVPITQAEASYSQSKFGAMLCRKCQQEAR